MIHLPPESAWHRSELGGLVESERLAIAGVSLQYQLARSWVAEPDQFPELVDFFPPTGDEPEEEPSRELTFDDWVQALLPMAR